MSAAVVEMSAAVSRNLGILAYFNSAKPGFRRAGSETNPLLSSSSKKSFLSGIHANYTCLLHLAPIDAAITQTNAYLKDITGEETTGDGGD
jgi:hypothetical protein